MQHYNTSNPFTSSLNREIPAVHYPFVATSFGVQVCVPPPLRTPMIISEVPRGVLPSAVMSNQFHFQGGGEPLKTGARNAVAGPAPSTSISSSVTSHPPPGFSYAWSLAQSGDKIASASKLSKVPLKSEGENERPSITIEQPVLATTGSKLNSYEGASNRGNGLLDSESESLSVTSEGSTSTLTATTSNCSNAAIDDNVANASSLQSEKVHSLSSSSPSLSRLNPDVQEFIPKLSAKRPRPCDSNSTEKSKSEKKEESQKTSPSIEDLKNSSGNKQEEPSSLVKLSKKAPFLFQLPPKPQCLKQVSGSFQVRATKDSETQTEKLLEPKIQRLCAACGQERNDQKDGNSALGIVKSVSRDHKIKYVAYQAAMLMRENLDLELDLRTRLKTKLQAMCCQFGSSVTAKSEFEDATICRIAIDLLNEQPVFKQEDKQLSFLRHLSAEADVQLEIAYELMAESPVKKTNEILRQLPNKSKNTQISDITSSSAKDCEISSSTSYLTMDNDLSSEDSSSSRKPFPKVNLMCGSNNGQIAGHVPKASKTEPEVDKIMSDPRFDDLAGSVNGQLTFSRAGDKVPPAALNVPSVDIQEAAQLLKWQQSYLQSMLGSLNLDAKAGAIWPGLTAPINNQKSEQLPQSSKEQFSAPSVVHSNLTTANLVKHNSLLNQEEVVRSCKPSGSDISTSTDRDACKSSYPTKPAARIGKLRKLPPLDLKAFKRAPVVSSQQLSAHKDAGSSVSHFSATTPIPNPYNTKGAEVSMSDSGSESQILAMSDALSQASVSVRQPNISSVSAISKSRKFLTPLQRKRLKKLEESAKAAETDMQSSELQHFIKETDRSNTDFFQVLPDASIATSEENQYASKKRASPLSSEFDVGTNISSYLSSNVSSNFSTSQGSSQSKSIQNFNHGLSTEPYSFSAAIPSTFSFPSFPSRSIVEAPSPDSSAMGQISPPLHACNFNSMVKEESLPVASLSNPKSSLPSQNQTLPSTQYVGNLKCPELSAKKMCNNFKHEIFSELSPKEIEEISTYLSDLSQSPRTKPAALPEHFFQTKKPTFSKVAYGDQVDELISSYCNLRDQPVKEIKMHDENNYAYSSSLSDHNLDDLETVDDYNSVSEGKGKSDVDEKSDDPDADRKSDNPDDDSSNISVPFIDWYSFDFKRSPTIPVAIKNHEDQGPHFNLAEQSLTSIGSSNENDALDLDSLINERLKMVQSAASKGGYGLDEISLTDSKKKLPSSAEIESKEKKETKPMVLDDGWQMVGNSKKSSKKSRLQVDVDILKFQTEEKYTNLVNLILEKYKVLEREEAQEVLETVYTSTNQLAGLRQKQILAEVDMVVTEWYSERIETAMINEGGETSNVCQKKTKSDEDAILVNRRPEIKEQETVSSCLQELDEIN